MTRATHNFSDDTFVGHTRRDTTTDLCLDLTGTGGLLFSGAVAAIGVAIDVFDLRFAADRNVR